MDDLDDETENKKVCKWIFHDRRSNRSVLQTIQIRFFTCVEGECEANVIPEGDRANNLISVVYNINDFKGDARCRKAVAPKSLGYFVQYDFDRLLLDMDLRTLELGVAVRTMTMTRVVDSVQVYVPSIL
jgi:hypothetical protein